MSDFLSVVFDRANERIKINAAEEKIAKLRDELTCIIQARRITPVDMKYVDVTAVYRADDVITFVTSENTYLCIGIDVVWDDGSRPELDLPFLSIAKALEYGILTAYQVQPLLEAEREESTRRARDFSDSRDQQQAAKKADWLKEFLETPEGIGAAISICGVEATKKYLNEMPCPICGSVERCRCDVPSEVV